MTEMHRQQQPEQWFALLVELFEHVFTYGDRPAMRRTNHSPVNHAGINPGLRQLSFAATNADPK